MTKDTNDHARIDDSEILTTKSVNSTVFVDGDRRDWSDVAQEDKDTDGTVGHVMLMDWDNVAERKATKWAGNLPGITIVLESSPGSFHAWNLSVGDLKTTACRLILNDDDRAHVEAGIKRGYWRLRYTPKRWDYKEEVHKDAPELVTVTLNRTERPQSRPHYRLAKAMYDAPDLPVGFDMVGEALSVEEYETMTDKAKGKFTVEE